jgi:subtilase family serine protease
MLAEPRLIRRRVEHHTPMQKQQTPLLSIATLSAVALSTLAGCTASQVHEELSPENVAADRAALSVLRPKPFVDLCDRAQSGPGTRRCHAKARVLDAGNRLQEQAPSGLGPADLRSAYNLPPLGGRGKTVAVVDAFDNPNAESELATYREQFSLAPCTTANGCFRKVAQDGSSNFPPPDPGWAGEISLDVQMVSAACPDCRILLVEANSASEADLDAAVNEAASLGAAAISNSYGGTEGTEDDSAYDHPGIVMTASSGDSGYGAEFPATSSHVLAVGGTSLTRSSSARGWAESAWSNGGSGCSGAVPKPTWQGDTGCTNRSEVDISAVADPGTGVAVYTDGSWSVFGGTSAASPIVAAIYTLLGVGAHHAAKYAWAHPWAFFDVTTGSNGTCSPSYLCNAGPGFDGPTGWGTPNGAILAFP